MRQMLLHIEAFEHRCLSTQKHLPREALTYTRLCTQKLLDTDGFSENHRSFDTEKPLHRESFTHRSFYTHTSFSTEAFTQRSFWARAFTHRRLYKQKACTHRAFTHRSFYTEKPLHTDAFPQKNRFHRAAFTHFKKSQFYVFDVWPSYRAKGLHPALENRNSWRWTIILREMGCAWPCKIAFLHQFYFAWNSCAWRSKMDSRNFTPILERLHLTLEKAQFSHSYYRLAFMPRLHLNFQNTPVFDGWPSFRAKGLRRALPNLHFATCLDVRPARSLSPQTVAAGPRTNKTRISPHVWVSDTPQRVTFRKPPPGCRYRQREIEELEKSDFAGVHIQFDHWKLAELLCSNSCATISVQMTLQAGLL